MAGRERMGCSWRQRREISAGVARRQRVADRVWASPPTAPPNSGDTRSWANWESGLRGDVVVVEGTQPRRFHECGVSFSSLGREREWREPPVSLRGAWLSPTAASSQPTCWTGVNHPSSMNGIQSLLGSRGLLGRVLKSLLYDSSLLPRMNILLQSPLAKRYSVADRSLPSPAPAGVRARSAPPPLLSQRSRVPSLHTFPLYTVPPSL